jgi:U1 small nuclear ribonucleoprotein C
MDGGEPGKSQSYQSFFMKFSPFSRQEQAQNLIDATTAAFKAGKIPQNPFAAGPPGMGKPGGVSIPPPGIPPPRPGMPMPNHQMPPMMMMRPPMMPMMGMQMAPPPGMRMMNPPPRN